MVKINIKEIQGSIYESDSIKRQAHFLNLESLLKNISRFFERYSERYGNIQLRMRRINKMMLDEVNIHLERDKINVESSIDFDVTSNFRAFLKINDPHSFYYTLKVDDRRMVVKVNRFESNKKMRLFILSQKDSNNLEKQYFDDFSGFISRKSTSLKTITYKDDGFKENLKVWNEFKPNEWTNAFKKVNSGKMDGIVLLPVGNIVGSTIKDGFMALSNENKLNKKNTVFKYKENNFAVKDSGNVFNSVGITINRVFW